MNSLSKKSMRPLQTSPSGRLKKSLSIERFRQLVKSIKTIIPIAMGRASQLTLAVAMQLAKNQTPSGSGCSGGGIALNVLLTR